MKEMEIGFSTRPFRWNDLRSYGSAMVRWFEGFPYSHTFMIVDGTVYEARTSGVKATPAPEWFREAMDRKWEVLVSGDTYECQRHPAPMVGRKYDFLSVILYPLFILTRKWYARKDTDRLYCSEYVAYCLGREDFYRLSPRDVFEDYVGDVTKG